MLYDYAKLYVYIFLYIHIYFRQASPVHRVMMIHLPVMTAAVYQYHGIVIENPTVKMAQMNQMTVVI